MTEEQLYPKTINELLLKLDYIIMNEQNCDKISIIMNWIEWFKNQKYELKYECKNNEFLRAYCFGDKFSLQVWNRGDDVDSLELVLLSNFYSEYDTEITKITE